MALTIKQVHFTMHADLDAEGNLTNYEIDDLSASYDGTHDADSDEFPDTMGALAKVIAVIAESLAHPLLVTEDGGALGGQPLVGLDDVIDSFLLAMHAEGIDHDTKARIVTTVRDAVDNNLLRRRHEHHPPGVAHDRAGRVPQRCR